MVTHANRKHTLLARAWKSGPRFKIEEKLSSLHGKTRFQALRKNGWTYPLQSILIVWWTKEAKETR